MAIYTLEGRAYWADADPAGIVYFARLIEYCARAEEEFLVTTAGAGWRPGLPVFPRVRVECDFQAPIRVHERWRVSIDRLLVGKTSLDYRFTVENLDAGATAARGRIVTVALDPATGRPVQLPEELRRALLRAGAEAREG